MPNPKDLQGLEIRQTLKPQRQLLFYSPRNTFSCTIRQGDWLLSVRVVGKALPEAKVIDTDVNILQMSCINEQEHRTTTFYIPPIDYVPAIVR